MLIAKIAASSNGANQIIAGSAGSKYRVIAFLLSFSGTVNAKWQDGTTDVTGLIYGAANTQVPSPPLPQASPNAGGPTPQFVTSPGSDLTLNLSAGTAVGGYVLFEKVPASM